MDPTRSGLSEAELLALATASGRDAADLAAELEKRPWAIHDLLSDPDLVRSVLEPTDLDPCESAFVFFAVMTRAVANDLLDRSFVHDWVGPSFRLPVFDVEPLQEFVAAPHRVLISSCRIKTARWVTSPWGLSRRLTMKQARLLWGVSSAGMRIASPMENLN